MARNYHGYGENLERGAIGKSNMVKKKNSIAVRRASNQCKTSAQSCCLVKRFQTKERPMLSFEQYGSFDMKRTFGDQGVEHKCILPNTQFQVTYQNPHSYLYHVHS